MEWHLKLDHEYHLYPAKDVVIARAAGKLFRIHTQDEEMCDTLSPTPGRAVCSREKGHTGVHVGHTGPRSDAPKEYEGTTMWGEEVTEEFLESLYVFGRLQCL